MAYNREWDRGKDSWDEGHSWQSSEYRSNVRERDDDYGYNDNKRRKYNNGGYEDAYNYDESSSYPPPHHHRREDQWSHDYTVDDRSRGPGGGPGGGVARKRLVPSEPSPHVIFLGLDPDFTEADLQAYLVSKECNVETVTIIRERTSGASKGFGFAQFSTVDLARAFVDPNFPFIQVPPPASHGATATAAFWRAMETNSNNHNGRRVKIDYSQSATPHDRGRSNRANMNDGTRDIGNAQGPVLLFRGLDPLSGPQAIHQAMLNSAGPGKQGAKGMRRIILIKDKVTMASFGFTFIEFVDNQSAATVLANTMSAQLHPEGFRISDRPVAASFAHAYSFQLVTNFLQRDEACLMSTNSLGGGEGQWVRYWDESSTVAVLEFKVEEPVSNAAQAKEKKEKKKHKSDDAHKAAVAAPSALPVLDKPVTLSFNKGAKAAVTKIPILGVSLDDAPPEENKDEPANDPNKPLVVKKVAPLISSKKTVNNIHKWNQVQEELAHDVAEPVAPPVQPVPAKSLAAPVASTSRAPSETAPEADELEFSDSTALMCILCSRQFKTLDVLKRHNKESELHKKNYQDASLREVARQKMAARKATEQPKYRDRASERRTLFNQPDTPMPEKDASSSSSARKKQPTPPPPPPPPPVNPGKDESNVGNKLLKMMGWKEGSGLGTEGEGRVDPIETAVYAQGVGLGASKGKDIGKYTEGLTSYVGMAQNAARERYNAS
ncbi:hypothetical protein BJ165DRAFT_1505888 [Panaeolus papilionaceus]|nr:hypothetical protein BJ165DRAFT_1505888 [Panaeolus papilionaceus]